MKFETLKCESTRPFYMKRSVVLLSQFCRRGWDLRTDHDGDFEARDLAPIDLKQDFKNYYGLGVYQLLGGYYLILGWEDMESGKALRSSKVTYLTNLCLMIDCWSDRCDRRRTATPTTMLTAKPFRRKCLQCFHQWSTRSYVRDAPRNHNPTFQYVFLFKLQLLTKFILRAQGIKLYRNILRYLKRTSFPSMHRD